MYNKQSKFVDRCDIGEEKDTLWLLDQPIFIRTILVANHMARPVLFPWQTLGKVDWSLLHHKIDPSCCKPF